MRTPLGYHVDHLLGRLGCAKHPDGLLGRVEDWAFGSTRMRTPLGFHVDHSIGRVCCAKQTDGLFGRVEVWACGATRMRAWTNHFEVGLVKVGATLRNCLVATRALFVMLCKPILAILLQRKASDCSHASRVLCFVNHPCNVVTTKKTSDDHRRMHLAWLLCFVNPSLQYCYKENIRRASCISHVGCVL